MKKLLSVVIASLVVFAALPFAAAADEAELVPVSISAVQGKPLLEGVEGHIENLGEENECFVYDLYLAEPIIFENVETKEYENGNEFEWYAPSFAEPTVTLELADGMVEEYTYDNFYRIYEK